SSEWCIYHARFKKRRRAVLAVLPFVEFWSSGRKCATITVKSPFVLRRVQMPRSMKNPSDG
ncbi:MAG: hypothetical protein IIX42_03790, partial [Alistipes sp.]|nr:hypothetical protein [Alistipes sp.]